MKRVIAVAMLVTVAGLTGCDRKSEKPKAEEPTESSAEDKEGAAKQKQKAEEPSPAADIDCDAKAKMTAGKKGELADDSPLLNPDKATAKAPKTFWVNFKTTAGPVVVQFHRDWSPHGVDRVYNLVEMGYYEHVAFFRVIENFMAQFGIHGVPAVNEAWKEASIPDDPVEKSNTRGMVTFAKKRTPNSRTVQLFINYKDNSALDQKKFAPIGKVEKCMENVDALYAGYGEGAPRGSGPS